ncbi:MAG TPA: glycosyltransferase family 2 protein [Falsiroseomonas sp.]|nr:glycosyltransferase family 2 protein [Falsiroseomonas sp.]
MTPLFSIIIPTFNRPDLLARAVESARSQTLSPHEIVIVDDGSEPPARIVDDPGIRLVRLPANTGGAKARNAGLAAARGRFTAFLDDDDELHPRFAELSLAALQASSLPPPVAVLSALEIVDDAGRIVGRRVPASSRRGEHYALEEAPEGTTWLCKQTLFAPTSLLRDLGGFDEAFRSRVHSELFLRLSPVCSLDAIGDVTYRLHRGSQERVSTDRTLRNTSFDQLVAKHADVLRAHPRGFARMLVEHARTLRRQGEAGAARRVLLRAGTIAPRLVISELMPQRVSHVLRAARRR